MLPPLQTVPAEVSLRQTEENPAIMNLLRIAYSFYEIEIHL
jgi:hypothetical protein